MARLFTSWSTGAAQPWPDQRKLFLPGKCHRRPAPAAHGVRWYRYLNSNTPFSFCSRPWPRDSNEKTCSTRHHLSVYILRSRDLHLQNTYCTGSHFRLVLKPDWYVGRTKARDSLHTCRIDGVSFPRMAKWKAFEQQLVEVAIRRVRSYWCWCECE